MQKISKLAIAALFGALMAAPAVAADKPFVMVNGVAVSQATAEIFLAQGKANGMPDTAQMKSRVREELIRRELMFQAAKNAGFDAKPEVAAQVDAATQKLLAQIEAVKQVTITRAYIDDFIKKNAVSDSQLKSTYETMKAKGGKTDYKARHILVKNEDEAKSIIAQLDKGAKFEELAKQSIDPGGSGGGDLGWSSPAKFVKPFADALVSLKKGKYTVTPVKTEFGYHVIKLEDTRPLNVPSFAEMKPVLLKDAQMQALDTMVTGLRAKAKIE
jgi:peptidyl-prolyl cis-trans isomerase C